MTDDRIKFDYVLCSSRIRELREAKKESHATLGNAVSINEQTLKNYEQAALYKGQSTGKDRVTKIAGMNINNLCKLADHFGVSTDYLLGRSDTQTADADIQVACKTTGLTEKATQNAKMIDSPILSDLLENDQFLSLLDDIENLQGMDAYLDSLLDTADDKKVMETSMAYNFVRVVRFELRDSFGQLVEEIVPTKDTLARAQEKLNETGLLSATDEYKAKKWRATNGERS